MTQIQDNAIEYENAKMKSKLYPEQFLDCSKSQENEPFVRFANVHSESKTNEKFRSEMG